MFGSMNVPDLPWRTLVKLPLRRPFRLPVAISWRLQRAAQFLAFRVSCGLVQAVSRIRAFRAMPRFILALAEEQLVRADGNDLFDPAFYLDRNKDVRAAGIDPLHHYLRHGWCEGRLPNPDFDDAYYRLNAGLSPDTPVSALGHYLAFGKASGLSPVQGLDLGVWRKQNTGVAVAKLDPYDHFLKAANKRAHRTGPPEPSDTMRKLEALEPHRPGPVLIDVVMPVFAGRAETLSAIQHVLSAKGAVAFELIVIDDCSPDAALVADLEHLAALKLFTLVRNSTNQGFIAAINTGMAINTDRDVVWLNSDTQVYDEWLDRLRDAAYSRSRVATVTPLSNNATLCSYPRIDTDNAADLECDWRDIASLAAQVNDAQRVEVPTAVGFCTYTRRDAVEIIGTLDQDSFGRGYGEENDFSRRAIASGWTNLAAADVLVRHFGGVSFGQERSARIEHALALLDRRYPDYHGAVHRFLFRNRLRLPCYWCCAFSGMEKLS